MSKTGGRGGSRSRSFCGFWPEIIDSTWTLVIAGFWCAVLKCVNDLGLLGRGPNSFIKKIPAWTHLLTRSGLNQEELFCKGVKLVGGNIPQCKRWLIHRTAIVRGNAWWIRKQKVRLRTGPIARTVNATLIIQGQNGLPARADCSFVFLHYTLVAQNFSLI